MNCLETEQLYLLEDFPMDHYDGGCRSSQFDGRVYLLDVEFTDEKFVEFEAEPGGRKRTGHPAAVLLRIGPADGRVLTDPRTGTKTAALINMSVTVMVMYLPIVSQETSVSESQKKKFALVRDM